MRIEELLKKSADAGVSSAIYNIVGYAGSSLTGLAATTAAVGSWTAAAGIAFVGGVALYVPFYLLKQTLQYFKITSELLHSTLDLAFYVGAAATGALLLGANIPAAVMCAAVGVLVFATLDALFSSPKKPETAEPAVNETQAPAPQPNREVPLTRNGIHARARQGVPMGHHFFNAFDAFDPFDNAFPAPVVGQPVVGQGEPRAIVEELDNDGNAVLLTAIR